MKLRFDLDQAASQRAGLVPSVSPAVIDIDTAKIKPEVRNLIADRLIGNDVCQLWNSERGTSKSIDSKGNPVRLVAEAPTFEALVKAVLKDAQILQGRRACHRAIALARANSIVESQPVTGSGDTSRFIKVVVPKVASPAQTSSPASAARVKKPRKKRIPLKRTRKKIAA